MGTNWTAYLVIILSVGFIILITLSIFAAILAIAILRRGQVLMGRLEKATENMGEIGKELAKKIAPLAAPAIIGAVVRRVMRTKRKNREED